MKPVSDDDLIPEEWIEFNDRIWGAGNWDRCRRQVDPCRDSLGNLAFHHIAAHD